MKIFILVLLTLSIQSLFAAQMRCAEGSYPSSFSKGFFAINDKLFCIKHQSACVDQDCPAGDAVQCDEGEPMTATVGFAALPESDNSFSCPVIESACVNLLKCPMASPMMSCEQGQAIIIQKGFYKISDTLSCPILESKCVDFSVCPQY